MKSMSIFSIEEKFIPGVYEISFTNFFDDRGFLCKPFNTDVFKSKGLNTDWREIFFSYSKPNVVRGMHFQKPPKPTTKLVWCVHGRVFDVVFDMRRNSATFEQHLITELSAEKYTALYIPVGCAHGFCTVDEPATLGYLSSQTHSADLDSGINWESIGVTWPVTSPLLSPRDTSLKPWSKTEFEF